MSSTDYTALTASPAVDSLAPRTMSDSPAIMPATIAEPDLEGLRKLREPFPPEQIGMLPKPTKKDNKKGTCKVCGKYHGLPAVHLDYVGHAAVTDRLRSVDPTWTWEPMALAADGLPAVRVGNGMATLWIRLTVCGVTRPGVGVVDATKTDVNKELISDAIRNAAMRFGVALDLWSKEELHFEGADAPSANGNGPAGTDADQRDDSAHVPPTRDREALVTQVRSTVAQIAVRSTVAQIAALDADQGMAADAYVEGELRRADLTPAELRQLGVKLLQRLSKVRNGSAPPTESVDTETGEVQEVGAAVDA